MSRKARLANALLRLDNLRNELEREAFKTEDYGDLESIIDGLTEASELLEHYVFSMDPEAQDRESMSGGS